MGCVMVTAKTVQTSNAGAGIHNMAKLTPEMVKWLDKGERGVSSETIFETLTGHELCVPSRFGYLTPTDAFDFIRCHKLLQEIPEFRVRIREVGQKHPHWKPLTDNWIELELLYLSGDGSGFLKLNKRLHELNDKY
jgi:hypothetical protein